MLKDFLILRQITGFILPYIFLYGLFIQINGEASPGGGFQAGAIFASSLIAFNLIYGKSQLNKHFSEATLTLAATLGVLIYAGTGAISFLFDDNFLDYYSLATDKLTGQYIGIFIIEIGVGLTVASVMCLIYSVFQAPDKEIEDK